MDLWIQENKTGLMIAGGIVAASTALVILKKLLMKP